VVVHDKLINFESLILKKKISNISKDFLFSFTKVCSLKKIFLENFNISTNDMIIEAAKALWYGTF